MRLNRLMGVLTCLLQNERFTAKELAERFEVSPRTILRDIETLSLAGVPVVTAQGGKGGISLMEGYTLPNDAPSSAELQKILIGLKSLESISEQGQLSLLMNKLTANHDSVALSGYIHIDLSSYYKESLTEKIRLLGGAIGESRCVRFIYYSEKGQAPRMVEPYFIQFKWTDWYLFGWCRERRDFRMFKLNRLWDLTAEANFFSPRPLPPNAVERDPNTPEPYSVTMLFDKSVRFRLIECYGPHCFQEREDGLLMTLPFANRAFILQWILSFGSKCRVLAPGDFRHEVYTESIKMTNFYSGGNQT